MALAKLGRDGAATHSIMRRQIVAQAAKRCAAALAGLLAEVADFSDQQVDLQLLIDDDLVQLIDHVLGEAGLDLEIGQALFDVVCLFHAAIGTDIEAGTGRRQSRLQ